MVPQSAKEAKFWSENYTLESWETQNTQLNWFAML
jgi:hypothetical protein